MENDRKNPPNGNNDDAQPPPVPFSPKYMKILNKCKERLNQKVQNFRSFFARDHKKKCLIRLETAARERSSKGRKNSFGTADHI